MKYIMKTILTILLVIITNAAPAYCRRDFCKKDICAWNSSRPCAPRCCLIPCCNVPYCGPYPRPLPGQYDSFKDNTKILFWNIPPCAPRNDSKERGYLYKGMWWDITGARFWAFRNNTDNTITVEGLAGGEIKDIPAGDVVNISRGESYAFRVQAPARRFELFNSDAHNIEIFLNINGDISYRAEPVAVKTVKAQAIEPAEVVVPKF